MKSMRDVTPVGNALELKNLFQYLFEFVKNPVQKIKTLPDWNWPTVFATQLTIAIVSGLLSSLFKLDFNFWFIAKTIFLMPIITTLMAFLLTFFIFYYFQFFENRTEGFRKILILVILASIPFFIFQIASVYFAPITLIGFGFTSLLAIVGLTENFNVERNRAYVIVGILFLIVLVTWVTNRAY